MYLDTEVLQHLKPWKYYFDQLNTELIGETNVDLSRTNCYFEECNIGSFLADTFVYYFKNISSHKIKELNAPLIGLIVAGDIRASLMKGRK